MAVTLRLTKGSELKFQELDDNFTDLNSRVITLETNNTDDISLTSLSVTTASAGTAGLSYNNTAGVFTYTPPDLSSYLTSVPAQSFASLTGKPTTIAGYGITDAFDGEFSSLTNKPTTLAGYGITDGGGAGGIALTDISVTTASASGTPSLAYNNTTGVFTYTPPDLSNAIVSQAQYTTTVTTDAADPTDTAHHVLGNTGTPSIHNSSTAWYYGDVVHDPANPTTSVVLDIDSGILTGDVVGDITSAGTSTFSGTVDFSASSNVDFTGATVSGLSSSTWATLGDKDGANGPQAIIIGENAVGGIESVAIGKGTTAGDYAQAIGNNAGNAGQGVAAVALGSQSGESNQGTKAIAVGQYAGQTTQGVASIAIGQNAGLTTQGDAAIAIGQDAGSQAQGYRGIAIGEGAGETNQASYAIAIGYQSGETAQESWATAVGFAAGTNTQGDRATAIGSNSGQVGQGAGAVAIGVYAGNNGQGADAVAIGKNAGHTNQAANSIAINATGTTLQNSTASSLVIKPIRNAVGTTMLMYDATSGEVTHSGNVTLGGDLDVGGNSIVSASNGAINIAPDGSGTIDLSGQVKFAEGMIEKFATTNGATGVTALDCSTGNVHYLTAPAGDITANFTNLNLTAEYATNVTVVIDQGGTEREITAVQIGGVAQTIVWQGNSAPTGTANGVDSFSFTILNDGGTYVVLGQMVAFGGV